MLSPNLCRKGVADEILAKNDERGRPSEREPSSPHLPLSRSRKRARSMSSSASDSVSTISTNQSRSPNRPRPITNEYMMSQQEDSNFQSPAPPKDRKRRYRSSSSMSYSSPDEAPRRKRQDDHRRRRQRTISPDSRGRPSSSRRGSRRSRSRTESVDKSRVARERKSMTPQAFEQHRRRSDHAPSSKEQRARLGRGGDENRPPRSGIARPSAGSQMARKERSLSPYSRRLALTQSMNMVQ